jgi:DNA topoisomerase-1
MKMHLNTDGEEDSEKEPEHTLPIDIEVGQNHNVIAGKVIATKTKPRSRYTVPSLVKLLEKKELVVLVLTNQSLNG